MPSSKENALPNTQEIAQELVALCRVGKVNESGEKSWADVVVGLQAMPVRGKGAPSEANRASHDVTIKGPYVNGDQFAVGYKMDITPKDGERTVLYEVGVYTSPTARSSRSGSSTEADAALAPARAAGQSASRPAGAIGAVREPDKARRKPREGTRARVGGLLEQRRTISGREGLPHDPLQPDRPRRRSVRFRSSRRGVLQAS